MRLRRLIVLLIFAALRLQGQEGSEWDYELRGYLKYFGAYGKVNDAFFDPNISANSELQSFDQQLHNRFDFKLYHGAWSMGIGMRNRLFNGSQLKSGGLFLDILDTDPGLVDLSMLYWRNDEVVLHTIIDRLWFQYQGEKFGLRLGRQRINWGINTIWNPNDILNQYNFFDFDYEERPGSDALRLQYFPSFTSTWELAIAPAEQIKESTAALLYKNTQFSYDFQIIGAFYRNNISLGGGWAGNIWQLGFKGEANYYWGLEQAQSSITATGKTIDEYDNFVFSTALDYVFSNGLYISASYLLNAEQAFTGIGEFNSFNQGVVLSPKNPFPFAHTIALNSNFAFSPIFNGSLTFMYAPENQNLILFPSLSYSLGTNLDLLLAAQVFLTENARENQELQWLSNNFFVRLKWSF